MRNSHGPSMFTLPMRQTKSIPQVAQTEWKPGKEALSQLAHNAKKDFG